MRRHSFVDLLEHVSDGVHVTIVERQPQRDRAHATDERVRRQPDREPETQRPRHRP